MENNNNSKIEDQNAKDASLVTQGYTELMDVIQERKFNPSELMELVAITTKITKKMINVTNRDKKRILMSMIEKYIQDCDYTDDEKKAALIILATLDVSIDVLYDFRKGRFDSVNGSKGGLFTCLILCCGSLSKHVKKKVANTNSNTAHAPTTKPDEGNNSIVDIADPHDDKKP
jgi:hypothetical protein